MSLVASAQHLVLEIEPGAPLWCAEMLGGLLPILVHTAGKATEAGVSEFEPRVEWITNAVLPSVDAAYADTHWMTLSEADRVEFIMSLARLVLFLQGMRAMHPRRDIASRLQFLNRR